MSARRRVLVAVDESSRAPQVLATAADLAARLGASIDVLRVVLLPPEFPAAAAGTKPDPLPVHLIDTAVEDVERLIAQTAREGVAFRPPIVRFGQPSRVILEVGDELDADVIVIGSHAYGVLDRLLGTTAAHVANRARRDVYIVHARESRGPRAVPA